MADVITPDQRSSPSRRWRLALVTAPLLLAVSGTPALTQTAHASVPQTPVPGQHSVLAAPRGAVLAGQAVLFRAPRAAGVTAYTWTLTGPGVVGGHFSATCAPDTSQMESSFGRAGTIHIKLKVSFASGQTTSSAHALVVRAAKVQHATLTHATQWILCKRGPGDPAVRPAGNGGPPAGCQDEYLDGNIDAIGCLSVLPSYNKIPAPERRLLCRHFPVKCVNSKTPAVPELLPVASTRALRLNGIDIAPGKEFVLDQNDGWMASSNATVSLLKGLLPLHTGKLTVAEDSRPLFAADLDALIARYPALAAVLNLGSFHIDGKLTVTLGHDTAIIRLSLTLPPSFTGSGGKPATSSALVVATNQAGFVLDNLLIAVPSADFGGGSLEFDHLAFCYQLHISERFCEKKTGVRFGSFEGTGASSWNATANLNILGTEIKAVPTPVDPEQGIGFVNGQFDFAGATASFDPALPLGSTGISLTSLQASLALNPTRFQGSIGLTAGELVSINGQLFMVFASPTQPYTFTGHEVGATGMPTPTVHAFAIAVGGSVGLVLPVVGNTTLGSGYVLYVYPAYLAVGGNIGFSILDGALSVNGGVNGQFSLKSPAFDVEGTITIHALFLTMSADVIVSSVGVGACGSIGTPFGPVTAGVGYMWGGSVSATVGSCNLDPFRVIIPTGTNGPRRPIRFHVAGGLPSEMVQVHGLGGAPELTVTGPDGAAATIGAGSRAFGKPFAIYRFGHTTYIAIIKPMAGEYTITANRGSPKITEVLTADGRNGNPLHQRFGVQLRHG